MHSDKHYGYEQLQRGNGLPQSNQIDVHDITKNYDNNTHNNRKINQEEKLLLPFIVPFYFLSEKAAIYYHVYKAHTSALEKLFKERVFTDNNPITGITEARIDKFEFHATKRYQRGALAVLILTLILTFCAVLTSGVISLISSSILIYIFVSSFFIDLYYPARHYTYDSKKFSHEKLEITHDYYNNYIKNFHLTESVYNSSLITSWAIIFITTFFKDTIEYELIFDTGILTDYSWYVLILLMIIPTTMLVYYQFEKEKIKDSADVKREELIQTITETTKTNFDIARQKLKEYK